MKIASGSSPSGAAVQPPVTVAWYVWAAVLAVASSVIGVQWDIAWHRSIGRDTFWSPPHIAIYLGGVLAGLSCGYLILWTTFGRSVAAVQARAAAVRIWGFRGPLGAFIAAWGGIAMLASAPFDDWWHNAYGLDVKILSPPHSVLALGLVGIQLGSLIFLTGLRNRASGSTRQLLTAMYLFVGGFILVALMTFEMEYTFRAAQHSGTFYRVVATAAPLVLVGVGRASGHRFGTTITAAVYMGLLLALLWLFPLVPATPKLGPVYYPVTHLVPGGFPLLLIVPALLVDLSAPRLLRFTAIQQAMLLGPLFVLSFLAVQWPFASFLMSEHARNWIFGSHYFSFNSRRFWHDMRYEFADVDGSGISFIVEVLLAFVVATITTRLGLGWAAWMRNLRR